ncbi:ASST-domain-containing protein [Aspergillus cavernicola]|uniref:ASST-domain-containing protein n=1 Tax=Aspergillus cavernicola TaxID=176166 RepID=A0ABR4J1E1_9EURO
MWRPFFLALLFRFTCAYYIPFPEPIDSEPWPTRIYRSTSLLGPTVYFTHRSFGCSEDGKYTFLTPRGQGVAVRGPLIVDKDGELVWTDKGNYHTSAYNLDVQTYRGQDYLTFWNGRGGDDGHGDGIIYMLDSSYNEVYKIRGPISRGARRAPDLNEFQITRDDTALFTIYLTVEADLSSVGGPSRGWIWDGRFVEVDIETNKVLFEWSASDHFNFTDVTHSRGDKGEIYEDAWDFFHLHSVDKDGQGNYLISALYTDYLTYIDGRTGDIIWRLGGENSDFTDVPETPGASPPLPFTYPQDARFVDNDTAITLFDNASPFDNGNRGLYLHLNQSESEMTVKLRTEYIASRYYMAGKPQSHAQSQGSVQLLDSGNVLVSYGLSAPAWSEFDDTGNLLCHALFGHRSSFNTESSASYRVRKHPWKGYPSTKPDFKISDSEVAVSWNGATEVDAWILEGAKTALPTSYTDQYSKTARNPFTLISTSYKSSFETIISLNYSRRYRHLRIRAVDANGTHLGSTAILHYTHSPYPATGLNPSHQGHYQSPPSAGRSAALFFAGVGATVGLAALVYIFRRYVSSLRRCFCGSILWRRLGRYRPVRSNDDDDDEVDYRPRYKYDRCDAEAGPREQEVGLTHTPDSDGESESDGGDVEVSVLENPRPSALFARGDSPGNRSPRSPVSTNSLGGLGQGLGVAGVGAGAGAGPAAGAGAGSQGANGNEAGSRPMLLRSPSMMSSSSAAEREK